MGILYFTLTRCYFLEQYFSTKVFGLRDHWPDKKMQTKKIFSGQRSYNFQNTAKFLIDCLVFLRQRSFLALKRTVAHVTTTTILSIVRIPFCYSFALKSFHTEYAVVFEGRKTFQTLYYIVLCMIVCSFKQYWCANCFLSVSLTVLY